MWIWARFLSGDGFRAVVVRFTMRGTGRSPKRFYLPIYVKTWIRGSFPNSKAHYQPAQRRDAKGDSRSCIARRGRGRRHGCQTAEPVYMLTEEGTRARPGSSGLGRWICSTTGPCTHFLGHWIYHDQTAVGLHQAAIVCGAVRVPVLLWVRRCRRTRQRLLVLKHGRRLRGPELVTTTEFNSRHEADGMAFVNEEQTRTGTAAQKQREPMGTRAAQAGGDALPGDGRLGHGQERR